jgi:hypothetical protein
VLAGRAFTSPRGWIAQYVQLFAGIPKPNNGMSSRGDEHCLSRAQLNSPGNQNTRHHAVAALI